MLPGHVHEDFFAQYESKFRALADRKRLHILYELCRGGTLCVCDLMQLLQLPQSSLSYHLKILMDANLVLRETRGTWNYYRLNQEEVDGLLSEKLCCIFRPSSC